MDPQVKHRARIDSDVFGEHTELVSQRIRNNLLTLLAIRRWARAADALSRRAQIKTAHQYMEVRPHGAAMPLKSFKGLDSKVPRKHPGAVPIRSLRCIPVLIR